MLVWSEVVVRNFGAVPPEMPLLIDDEVGQVVLN
jgi:hypothetical protein